MSEAKQKRSPGRPKKRGPLRNKQVHIWVTEEERKMLLQVAEERRMPFAEWARARLITPAIRARIDEENN